MVGYSGAGVFTQSGGTVTTPNIYLGNNIDSGSTGAYTLSGGTVSASNLSIGAPATGTFTQSGGAATLSSGLYLGGGPTGIGTYNLSGTGNPLGADGRPGLQLYWQRRHGNVQPVGRNQHRQPALYISATIPPARPPTSSAAPATCRPPTSMSATLRPRRHCSNRPAARTRTNYLSISSGGTYQLAGGRCKSATRGLVDQGTFNGTAAGHRGQCDAAPAASWTSPRGPEKHRRHVGHRGGQRAAVVARRNERVELRQLHSPGLLHTAGSTLNVPAGKAFCGWGSINDPVACQGTITASAAAPSI